MSYPDEATYFAAARRWLRLLFERRARTRGMALGPPRERETSPAAVALAGAPSATEPLDAMVQALWAELEQGWERPLAEGRAHPLALLAERCRLDAREVEILLALVIYQMDPAFQRLHAEAVGGRRMSVGFLFELLAPEFALQRDLSERLQLSRPLRRLQLVRLGTADEGPGLGGRGIEAHERVVEFLCGDRGFDARLEATARLHRAEEQGLGRVLERLPYPVSLREELRAASQWSQAPARAPRRIFLSGPDRGAKAALLAGLAEEEERPLLEIDLYRLGMLYGDVDIALAEHLREGVLHQAWIYLDGHRLEQLPAPTRLRLGLGIDEFPAPLVVGFDREAPVELGGEAAWLQVSLLDTEGRLGLWRDLFAQAALSVPEALVREAAHRFILGYEEIRAAVGECAGAAALRQESSPPFEIIARAARRRQAHQLGKWAQRIECSTSWDDFIAPDETMSALVDMVLYVRHRRAVFDRWGFSRRLSRGAGLSALFYGPPGTGKTTAAQLIARELELDLFRVDLSKVTSMWIGESEKQLGELFEQATASQVILLFDEADSLFAKRTEVRTSVDRYANLGVNFLLQKIEDFPGVSILTTNKVDTIDEAFKRRLKFRVEFPLPEEEHRRRIWQSLIPAECPTAGPIDFARLAKEFDMGGGNIQNAVLRAAFMAAEAQTPLTEPQLRRAAREEYRNLGRLVSDQE
jgi:hypothetical protein